MNQAQNTQKSLSNQAFCWSTSINGKCDRILTCLHMSWDCHELLIITQMNRFFMGMSHFTYNSHNFHFIAEVLNKCYDV